MLQAVPDQIPDLTMSFIASRLAMTATFVSIMTGATAQSAELAVNVTGIEMARGEICCALYPPDKEFLQASSAIAGQWLEAKSGGVQCRFTGIESGAYAVAVFQDYNSNKNNDTNLFGIPTEPWGVSNNARPMFRAPTFEEAQVSVADGKPLEISVKLETTMP